MGQNGDNHAHDKETKCGVPLDATYHYFVDVLLPKAHSVLFFFQAKVISLQGTGTMPQVVGPHWWQKKFHLWETGQMVYKSLSW